MSALACWPGPRPNAATLIADGCPSRVRVYCTVHAKSPTFTLEGRCLGRATSRASGAAVPADTHQCALAVRAAASTDYAAAPAAVAPPPSSHRLPWRSGRVPNRWLFNMVQPTMLRRPVLCTPANPRRHCSGPYVYVTRARSSSSQELSLDQKALFWVSDSSELSRVNCTYIYTSVSDWITIVYVDRHCPRYTPISFGYRYLAHVGGYTLRPPSNAASCPRMPLFFHASGRQRARRRTRSVVLSRRGGRTGGGEGGCGGRRLARWGGQRWGG